MVETPSAMPYPGDIVSARIARHRRHTSAKTGNPVGFQNSAMGVDLGVYAACSYSLIRPPRTDRRLIRSRERPTAGWSGQGG